ncbi:MAG: DUF362 domain-containing protein, partial [Firmicutes bacterium]|nr:DUF362 domain-containing protein [Bacillota bacterium]
MPDVLIQETSERALASAVDELFEVFKVDLRGKRVVIKPNMLGPFDPERGVTTSPALLEAVVARVERDTSDIIVGDNPASRQSRVGAVARRTGILEASRGRFRVFEEPCRVALRSRHVPSIHVSREFLDCDYLINLPRFKTHALTRLTGCVKNLFGIIPGGGKPALHAAAPSYRDFSELVVDVYGVRPPDLNIVDALTIMEGLGPSLGPLVPYGRLISGTNGVEVDSVLASILSLSPSQVAMLEVAGRRGMGQVSPAALEVWGRAAPPRRLHVPLRGAALSLGNRVFDLGSKPKVMEAKCDRCRECVAVCPTGAMMDFRAGGQGAGERDTDAAKLGALGQGAEGRPRLFPRVERNDCIACYCCAEVCRP